MRKSYCVTAVLVSAFVLTACATTPDPAKVCTSDWISTRTDKAIDRIERRTSSSMKSLTTAAKSWSRGKKPGPFQMMALSGSLKSLEKELRHGRGMRDLKTLASTCDDPKIISGAMSNFMREKGLPENLINFIENMNIYQDLLKMDSQKTV